jgi:hypothetical protein
MALSRQVSLLHAMSRLTIHLISVKAVAFTISGTPPKQESGGGATCHGSSGTRRILLGERERPQRYLFPIAARPVRSAAERVPPYLPFPSLPVPGPPWTDGRHQVSAVWVVVRSREYSPHPTVHSNTQRGSNVPATSSHERVCAFDAIINSSHETGTGA